MSLGDPRLALGRVFVGRTADDETGPLFSFFCLLHVLECVVAVDPEELEGKSWDGGATAWKQKKFLVELCSVYDFYNVRKKLGPLCQPVFVGLNSFPFNFLSDKLIH